MQLTLFSKQLPISVPIGFKFFANFLKKQGGLDFWRTKRREDVDTLFEDAAKACQAEAKPSITRFFKKVRRKAARTVRARISSCFRIAAPWVLRRFREFHLDRSPANDLRCMDSRAGCVDGVKRHVRVAELPILPRRPIHFAPAVLLEVPAEVLGGDRPRNLAHEHPLARRRG